MKTMNKTFALVLTALTLSALSVQGQSAGGARPHAATARAAITNNNAGRGGGGAHSGNASGSHGTVNFGAAGRRQNLGYRGNSLQFNTAVSSLKAQPGGKGIATSLVTFNDSVWTAAGKNSSLTQAGKKQLSGLLGAYRNIVKPYFDTIAKGRPLTSGDFRALQNQMVKAGKKEIFDPMVAQYANQMTGFWVSAAPLPQATQNQFVAAIANMPVFSDGFNTAPGAIGKF